MELNNSLGFGCSSLGSNINLKLSLKLLNFAYKNKIKYFDLAPSYGDGKCHKIFGKFLENKKRNKIFISTKIGEIDNKNITKYRKFFPNLQILKKFVKYLLPNLSTTKKIKYNKNIFYGLLLDYLKDLKTNYIDCIFLHNLNNIKEIKKFLKLLNIEKKRGRVKYIGISLSLKNKIHKKILKQFDIIQLENSFNSKNYEKFIKKYGHLKKKIIFYGMNSEFKKPKDIKILKKFETITKTKNHRLLNLLYNVSLQKNSITLINSSKVKRIDEILSFIKLIKKDQSILNIINE